jgi:uroporphyrinogen-III decarboxylase
MNYSKRISELSESIKEKIMSEKVTPLERLNDLRNFCEPDRVTGSFAFWAPIGVGIDDISTFDYYNNPEKMYYCQLKALYKFENDYPLLLTDMYNTEPEALGAKIKYTDDDTPVVVEPAIKNKKDLYALKIPDPYKDGRLSHRMEICRMNHELMGDVFPTITAVCAPFSMAVALRGYQNLIFDMTEDPDFVHDLLNFCARVTIAMGNAIESVCGSFPSISDAWASIPNLSPEDYYEYSFPYAEKCFKAFKQSGLSFGGGHQFSKDFKKSLENILSTGCKSYNLFEENITGIWGGKIVNLKKVKEICKRNGVLLFTCVHPETMLKKNPAEIQALMKNWIKEISGGGGHAFYTSILPTTPFENIKSYVRTLKESIFRSEKKLEKPK